MDELSEMTSDRTFDAFSRRTGISAEDFADLRALPLFAHLSDPALQSLLSGSVIRNFAQGTTLFLEGDEGDRFFVIREGWVKLYKQNENGNEITISVVSPGESFAEAAIFDNSKFPVNASTIADSRILVVRAEPVLRQLRDTPDLALNMLASMSRHLRRAVTQLEQISAMSSTERLADFLLRLTDTETGPAKIVLPLDKALIAARLGMQPETFSRALGKLKKYGVSSSGSHVDVVDVKVLHQAIKTDGNEPAGCC